MDNNVIEENIKDSFERENAEDNHKTSRRISKELINVSESNKKKHFSIINYQKFESFAGKLNFQESSDKLFANDKNLIKKAKNSVLKEKKLKKKNSNFASPSQSPGKLSHGTDSFFNFTDLTPDKFNLNLNDLKFSDYSKKIVNIQLKPTPFQLRKQENFQYRNSLYQKQRYRSITEENIFSSLNDYKDKLFTSYKLLASNDKSNSLSEEFPSPDSLKIFNKNNFFHLFKNSPNKRKFSPIKYNQCDSLEIRVSHFKKISSSVTEASFKLPVIKIKSNITTMKNSQITNEPK